MRARVTLVLSTASAATVLTLIVAYWISCPPTVDWTQKLDFAAKTAFASVAVISLLVGYQTLRLNIHKEQLKAAFDLVTRFDREEEKRARDRVDELFKITGEFREFCDDPIPINRVDGFIAAMKPEDKEAVRMVISYFEDLALSVRAGYSHEGVAFRSLGPVAIRYIGGLRPYILDVHRDTKEPLYYDDSLHLWKRWTSKTSAQ